jgi:hypothetical protein
MSAALDNAALINQHKRLAANFTRNRILSFKVVVIMLMMKGGKSLQLSLNTLIPKLGLSSRTVSRVAYSKARSKLKYTFFIALNQETVVRTMYEDGDYETWKNMRILGVDGSMVMLPTNDETVKEFGTIRYDNKQDETKGVGEHSYARASVLYDVLNRVALDATLASCRSYEVDLAAEHLKHTQAGDLAIYDRGYASYRMMALATRAPGDFLIRCPKDRFPVATSMLSGIGPDDVTVTLTAPAGFTEDTGNQGLPLMLTVRFVRVTLDNGEYEVLATSLLDQDRFPQADFKTLYYLRWGVETFYGILKTRLGLENFSGYSPEAIRQDFHVAVLLTGIESILTEDAEEQLAGQLGGHPKKVNKAVSFNSIKERVFELFMSNAPQDEVLEELTELFTTTPTLIRKDRKTPRNHPSSHQVLGWWKRKRKTVF